MMTEHPSLVRRLQAFAYHINETHSADSQDEKTVREAASTLEALQAENAELKAERDAAHNEAVEKSAQLAKVAVWAMYERNRADGNFVLTHDCDRVADVVRALKKDSPNGE